MIPEVADGHGDGDDGENESDVEDLPPGPDDDITREGEINVGRIDGERGQSTEVSRQRDAIISMKAIICLSIMAQSTNQKCNALQAMVGIFSHAYSAPEGLVDMLSHIGLSVSRSAIYNSGTSLSADTKREIMEYGVTLLAQAVYDNFSFELKHLVPTAEKPHDALLHLTSGILIPLQHGVTLEDLCCADQLWSHSPYNRDSQSNKRPQFLKIAEAVQKDTTDTSGMDHRQRFQAWKFLTDLVEFGPEYFRQFKDNLGEPEVVEAIPVEQSKQIPLKAMDINESTTAGNGEVLTDIFEQMGIGSHGEDKMEGRQDVGNHVVLVHGDLLTGERIDTLQRSRSEEKTSWRRYQHVVFVMGLFHFKMACADAIWKLCIYPKAARVNDVSLISQVKVIRPNEVGKITSNPGFWRMHEIIQHVGIASRLDCWRVEVKRRYGIDSLEEWAKTKPSWDNLRDVAKTLVKNYTACNNIKRQRSQPPGIRDKVHENMLLHQQLYLLYEETSRAMNYGDIGCVEECFLQRIPIFKSCGKHKYAAYMTRTLHDLYFVYPEGLKSVIIMNSRKNLLTNFRRAFRMNWLCNPTGKRDSFRGVDWWLEHNNFYTKRIYGGDFLTRTKERVIKESLLIQVYKRIRISFESMFMLQQRGYNHSDPLMEQTFKSLMEAMRDLRTHEDVPGRLAEFQMPDFIDIGLHKIMSAEIGAAEMDDEMLAEDVNGEDGDLDV